MIRFLALTLVLVATAAFAVLPAKDDFNRGTLGANWTNTTSMESGVGCAISGSSVLVSGGGTLTAGICFWNADTPTTASYACGQIVNGAGTGGPTRSEMDAGVCLGVDDAGTPPFNGNAMCCTASPPSANFGNQEWNAYGLVLAAIVLNDDAPLLWSANDYVGIERLSTTTFQCFRSTDGTTWTATSGVESVSGIPDPGSLGAYAWSGADNPFELTSWEGGNGTLPTDHICGTNTPATTSTTTSSSSTTTVTTTTTTTTARVCPFPTTSTTTLT